MDSPVRVLSHLPDVLAICLPAGNEDLVPTVLPDLQHSPVLPDLGDLADHHAAAGLPHLLALPAAAEPLQAALPEHRGGVEVLGGGAELGESKNDEARRKGRHTGFGKRKGTKD